MRIRVLAVAALVTLAGCASTSSPSSPSSAVPSSAAPSSSPSSQPSSETISGTVAAGVEPHCLVLRDASGAHSLYFHDESLRSSVTAGRSVTLTGHPDPGMMTTCQQGEPFIVTGVRTN